ncbi:probable RNA-dependent RNA polymerase 5 isoform X2 [Nymphaea colorata]|uniref:probable RNA-dependent RNA polymerase 5 isoform X2 n=1 Tax=Nymphaea colorata TaxID=210225 RepID=UPI00214E8D04|nr:probable RNA-dependent RNA polymerase 5 isoform X2 [Nymphaea colorata]
MSSPLKFRLSPVVESTLRRLREERSLGAPDASALEGLSSLPEETAVDILNAIAAGRVTNLSASIILSVKMHRGTGRTSGSASPAGSPVTPIERKECYTNNPELPNPYGSITACQSLVFRNANMPTTSQHLVVLGELEFRKAFLILSYVGEKRLENAISVDKILQLKDLPMSTFEEEVWRAIGRHCVPNGRLKQGPYFHHTTNILQRVLGDDNVLLVKFAETENASGSKLHLPQYTNIFHNVADDGIYVGLRLYRFFVYKDGGKEEKKKNNYSSVKCFFVRTESRAAIDQAEDYILSNKSITEARAMFMHVHTLPHLSKYMARFSLILSKTIELPVDLRAVNVEFIEDILCLDDNNVAVFDDNGKELIHTDGTGFISEDLALRCPKVVNGQFEKEKNMLCKRRTCDAEDPPLLIQFRLFYKGYAIKGTALINKMLPPNTIQVRDSMVKVDRDVLANTHSINSFEIVSTSVRPKKTFLSRYLIALLSYGGVPKDFFLGLVTDALDDAKHAYSNPYSALKAALKYPEMSDVLVRMLLVGIPLDEPYLQLKLSSLLREERKRLKEGKVYISDCYYLMGTVDPTGKLRSNQVCIILDHGQIVGEVLVYKHPGLHFGDIHRFSSTYIEELPNFVGNSKFAIFFPTQGPRSAADEIANSDFDGDMYWVSLNSKLLSSFRSSRPWERPPSAAKQSVKPLPSSPVELERELFSTFLANRFHPSNTISMAADSWLAYMDRLLTLGDDCEEERRCLTKKMLRLTNIFYDALDAQKTGKKVEVTKDLRADQYPHYLERDNSYISRSILGMIYDKVRLSVEEDQQPQEIWQLSCFTEEVPQSVSKMWIAHYQKYRADMKKAMELTGESKDTEADRIIRKYKQILYGAAKYEDSIKAANEIFIEARAIYQIVYGYAANLGSYTPDQNASPFESEIGKARLCSFVWNVAGPALCDFFARIQNKQPLLCLSSVLHDMLIGTA